MSIISIEIYRMLFFIYKMLLKIYSWAIVSISIQVNDNEQAMHNYNKSPFKIFLLL